MIQDIIQKIRNDLSETFGSLFHFLQSNRNLLGYCSQSSRWTVKQILEHISLTNHYLLILIRKGARKAKERSKNYAYKELLVNYDLDWSGLTAIGEHKSFDWDRPEHMEPTGHGSIDEIRIRLKSQMDECLSILHELQNGEGVLYKTTMTVNKLGKIDVYHYIYFLVQHAKRHLVQMEKIKFEFEKKQEEP